MTRENAEQPPRGRGLSRWVRLTPLVAIPLLLNLNGGPAWAYWNAGSEPGGSGGAVALTVNQGATPTASAGPNNPAGTAITISWPASTLSNGAAVSGYTVSRYDVDTLTPQTIQSTCTGRVAATTCVEASVPAGQWVYSVTPVFATNWRGAESPKSNTVRVGPSTPVNPVTPDPATPRDPVTSDPVTLDPVEPVDATTLTYVNDATGPTAALVELPAPSVPTLAFSEFTNTYWDGTGSIVFYRSAATSGSFTATAVTTDAAPGIPAEGFPDLGDSWTSTPESPGVNTYSWSGIPAAPGTKSVGAIVNPAGTSPGAPFTLTADDTAPTAGTVTYLDGTSMTSSVSVSFTAGTDDGSGIGARLLQRSSALRTGDICGAFGPFMTVTNGTNPTASPLADTVRTGSCYRYQYVVSDNVGNQVTAAGQSIVRH